MKKCCRKAVKKAVKKALEKERAKHQNPDEKNVTQTELPERRLMKLTKAVREEMKKPDHTLRPHIVDAKWWLEQVNTAMSGQSMALGPAIDEMLSAGLEAIALAAAEST